MVIGSGGSRTVRALRAVQRACDRRFIVEVRDRDLGAALFPRRTLVLVAHDDADRLSLRQKSFGNDPAGVSRDSSNDVHDRRSSHKHGVPRTRVLSTRPFARVCR